MFEELENIDIDTIIEEFDEAVTEEDEQYLMMFVAFRRLVETVGFPNTEAYNFLSPEEKEEYFDDIVDEEEEWEDEV